MTRQDHQAPGYYRTSVGGLGVIALHDGTFARERPQGFIRGATEDEAEAAFALIGCPPGQIGITFTTLALECPDQLVLIDTGYGEHGPPTAGRTTAHLRAAGHSPDAVGAVLLTHFHGDHISGLIDKDGGLVFPNAIVHAPRPEYDYWMDDAEMAAAPAGNRSGFELVRRVFSALGDRIRLFDWGDVVLEGITAVQLDGHTPGQSGFLITAQGESLFHVADITNTPLIFARRPDWQVAFDMDGDRAAEMRKRVLGEAADKRTRLFFFHAPFPGLGRVTRNANGFEFIPEIRY